MKEYLLPIDTHKEPIEFANQQWKVFWMPDEIKVDKDVQDVLVNFTEAEKHGVITTLKLFTMYETHAGSEYWGSRFKKMFDGGEFHRMAAVFAAFELAVHAPFYKKINELLHIDNPEFYLSYLDNPTLKARIKHIGDIIDNPNDLVSLAMFSMVEGAILYSNFAFLKHFQSQGKNKLVNIVRGINFSVRDENIHSKAGAWTFKHLLKKYNLSDVELQKVEDQINEGADKILEHETEISQMLFEKGSIDGITEKQLVNFVKSRINECLKELGFKKKYEVTYNPIKEWFYKGINDFKYNDFFSGMGSEYHRSWDEEGFVWKTQQ